MHVHDILYFQVSRHSRGNINKEGAEQSVCIYYYMHKTAAPIRESLFLRPIKHSRIRGKVQFREHRHRTNKVVHVSVLAGSVHCHTVLWGRVHLCVVHCTDFYNVLEEDLSFRILFQIIHKT
jgi:hypothetical protein